MNFVRICSDPPLRGDKSHTTWAWPLVENMARDDSSDHVIVDLVRWVFAALNSTMCVHLCIIHCSSAIK